MDLLPYLSFPQPHPALSTTAILTLMPAYKLAHVSLALRIITLKLATWELSACNS